MSSANRTPPDETEIENLLSRFKPQPTPRLLDRLKSAPWKRPVVQFTPSRAESPAERRIVWSLIALIVIMLVSAILFVPAVRVVASQIFHSFFMAPTSQVQVQVTLSSPGDLYSYSNPANFTLSVSEAQQKAGYPIKQTSPLPSGFELVGARYDPSYNTVILFYQNPQEYLNLWLTQRPVANSQDVFSIGPGAQVKLVKIGAVQGEFVQGGWQISSTQAVSVTQPAGTKVNIVAAWDNDLPQSTLRWQVAGMAYELRSSGYGGPSQSDLINWANELK